LNPTSKQFLWRARYENASTEILMKAMGIARQSLYDTFGDKRALFEGAFYRDETNSEMQRSDAKTRIDCQNNRVPFISLLANIRSL
jgi:AcrR family transcriptional regulator